jgi:hypothetical protein
VLHRSVFVSFLWAGLEAIWHRYQIKVGSELFQPSSARSACHQVDSVMYAAELVEELAPKPT